MSSCTSCGHQLGVGRFCTNCGAPVDSSDPRRHAGQHPGHRRRLAHRHRRAQARPRPRPTRARLRPRCAPPPPPRYPLFADEVEGCTPYGPLTTTTAEPAAEPAAAAAVADATRPSRTHERVRAVRLRVRRGAPQPRCSGSWRPRWSLALLDGRLVVPGPRRRPRRGRATTAAAASRPRTPETGSRTASTSPGAPRPRRRRRRRPTRTSTATRSPTTPATCSTASPRPLAGARRRHRRGAHLHAARADRAAPRSGWSTATPRPSTDDQGRTFDWYLGNRRIESVAWVFDDGSKVRQELAETRERADWSTSTRRRHRQSRAPARRRSRRPGEGTAARDFTAISEVSLVGRPAGLTGQRAERARPPRPLGVGPARRRGG